jgi:dephospho-CoA kinase
MVSAPRSSPPLRLVVGGGIGSGKTTVVRVLQRLGASVVIADEIGHRVLEPGGEAFNEVAAAWPQVVVEGRIDRNALAAIVFADPVELERLEALTHPAIAARLSAEVSAIEGDVVVETPIPGVATGPGWVRLYIDVPGELRLRRAVARGGDPDDVRRRMAAQLHRRAWLQWADRVLVNEGTLEELEAAVRALWDELHALR